MLALCECLSIATQLDYNTILCTIYMVVHNRCTDLYGAQLTSVVHNIALYHWSDAQHRFHKPSRPNGKTYRHEIQQCCRGQDIGCEPMLKRSIIEQDMQLIESLVFVCNLQFGLLLFTNSLLDCTFEKMTSLPIQTPWSSGSNEDGIRKICTWHNVL